MPTGKPKVGVVYKSAGAPVDPPKCIPAKAYERKYFVSLSQIKRLLAKKLLCGDNHCSDSNTDFLTVRVNRN
jgi:hypothetical protein